YLFGKGDGQDLISYINDGTPGKLNTLQFKGGVASSELALKQVHDPNFGYSCALEVSIAGTTDKITISGFFKDDNPTNSYNGVQQFKFADGTTWDLAAIKQRALNPQNQAPIAATPIADQATKENLGWTYQVPTGSFSDPEGSALTYGATKADGTPLPAWLVFNAETRTFSGTPPIGSAGNLSLKVVAKDIGGLSASSTFTLSLSPTTTGQTLTGTAANNTLLGGAGNDTLSGLAGNDTLDGSTGADAMFGGLGNDTYTVDDTADAVTENANEGTDLVQSSVSYTLAANVENLTLTGTAAIDATGNSAVNSLKGNTAANVLDGGAGADSMAGGTGDDTYIVDNTADVVTEAASAGTDAVRSSVTYTLATNVENLTLTGNTAINATGNAAANVLTGNAAANVLSGGTGADTMVGGAGNDVYVVDNAADVVTENANEGTDLVQASATHTLAANVENLTLTGTTAINATGNAGANVLTGNTGANTLNGGAGADTMVGLAGNDTYMVDEAADVVTENANEGTDLVQSGISYVLGAHLENLTLTGTEAINATGNAAANTLKGNTAANVLDGGAGADSMSGSTGDDTYIVDDVADVVTEGASGGTDTVKASVTYTLASNVENLTLTGAAAIDGTGNTLDNVLVGNAAANLLNGGAGADNMSGGAGDDTYVVGHTGDVVTENANEGNDAVQSSVTYTLSANVEHLTLTGTAAVNATGNAADNLLTGNTAANTLTGAAGNDTLAGGTGADKLLGGTGNDLYVFERGGGADVLTEDDNTAGNTDVVSFGPSIAADQLWFRKSGNNLEVSVIGTSDKMTLNNWYLGNQYHVEQFKTSDGKTLLDSQVQNLVQAMAAFAPPAAGQTTLPSSHSATLQTVIAANWH
uniref:calcium-binding protein n=1 Tax=Pseudorhodoferax sp. TaxID=1993553 RepID=UPI002DD68E8B